MLLPSFRDSFRLRLKMSPMTTESATPVSDTEEPSGARHRAAEREMRVRRRRVILNVIFFITATIAMLAVSLVTRDSQALKREETFSKQLVEWMNSNFRDRPLPIEMPMPLSISEELRTSFRNRYMYLGQKAREAALKRGRPQAVCYPLNPMRMFLSPNGRHVVMVTEDGFESVWFSEKELEARAEELGIVLIEPPSG
jgi:hypothetical protein